MKLEIQQKLEELNGHRQLSNKQTEKSVKDAATTAATNIQAMLNNVISQAFKELRNAGEVESENSLLKSQLSELKKAFAAKETELELAIRVSF